MFAVGFGLGAARVTVLEPAIGQVASVALEIPFMLGVSWLVARALVHRMAIDASVSSRLAMGLSGGVLLVATEMLMGLALGQPILTQLAAYLSSRGVLTAIGQIGFALMPLLV